LSLDVISLAKSREVTFAVFLFSIIAWELSFLDFKAR
jgi:hypothetical protein